MSLILLLTKRAQSGPAWRMTGVWSMLLIPFTANVLLGMAKRYPKFPAAGFFTYASILLILGMFMLQTVRIKQNSYWAFPVCERAAGNYLNELISRYPGSKILIESSGFFYLNIVVASQHPDSFVFNSISEQPEKREPVITPQRTIDESALAKMKIRTLVFKTKAYKDFLSTKLNIVKRKDFGEWSVYSLS